MNDGFAQLEVLACGLRPEASLAQLFAMIVFVVAAARLRAASGLRVRPVPRPRLAAGSAGSRSRA